MILRRKIKLEYDILNARAFGGDGCFITEERLEPQISAELEYEFFKNKRRKIELSLFHDPLVVQTQDMSFVR